MAQGPVTWSRQFTFRGKTLFYNRIPFNNRAERAVEVPLAFEFLARHQQQKKILEVGNVLSHYENALSDVLCVRTRRIIDKFEVADGIENLDLMELDPEDKQDAIICISTIEHVGQNCTPNGAFGEHHKKTDLEAPLKALAKVYDLLAVGGQALLTVPVGKLLDGGWYIQFSPQYLQLVVSKYGVPREALSVGYLKQVARGSGWSNPPQIWVETEPEALREVRYDNLWSNARAIAVIELTKLEQPFSLDLHVPATPLVYEHSLLAKNLFFMLGILRRWLR
jgi:hypothetical protein